MLFLLSVYVIVIVMLVCFICHSLRNDYVAAMSGVSKLLVRHTSPGRLLFIGELQSGAKDFKPKMVRV